MLTTSKAGRKAIADREGNKLVAYRCSAGVLTIGVGHTSAAGPPVVTPGMRITMQESDEILSRDLEKFEAAVRKSVRVSLTQNQFDALVSLAFNIGKGAFGKSTLVKRLNAGDYKAAAEQFLVWNKVQGRPIKGLTTRRHSERAQFLSPGNRVSAAVPTPARAKPAPVLEPTRNDGTFTAPKSETSRWGRIINRLLGREP